MIDFILVILLLTLNTLILYFLTTFGLFMDYFTANFEHYCYPVGLFLFALFNNFRERVVRSHQQKDHWEKSYSISSLNAPEYYRINLIFIVDDFKIPSKFFKSNVQGPKTTSFKMFHCWFLMNWLCYSRFFVSINLFWKIGWVVWWFKALKPGSEGSQFKPTRRLAGLRDPTSLRGSK